jgi:hypothetical protein
MCTHNLRPGDRVRVTRKSRLPGYRPGDRGWVRAGPEKVAGSELRFYLVAFKGRVRDKAPAVFAEDEIEPDR